MGGFRNYIEKTLINESNRPGVILTNKSRFKLIKELKSLIMGSDSFADVVDNILDNDDNLNETQNKLDPDKEYWNIFNYLTSMIEETINNENVVATIKKV